MTDKELLELAAKAAGIKCDEHGPYTNDPAIHCEFEKAYEMLEVRKDWNPLENDGDALRLAVKLNMDIGLNHPQSCIRTDTDEFWVTEPWGTDHYASTRRAITRAAAEMGMK